jgi:hypothetical protein
MSYVPGNVVKAVDQNTGDFLQCCINTKNLNSVPFPGGKVNIK